MNLDAKAPLSTWLTYIERIHPASVKLGLERIQIVANKLELIHFDCPVITIAGTNGKGSTVAILEAILLAQGYKVACYTSPHLLKFNERIRFNRQDVSDQYLVETFHFIEKSRADTQLTYFEYTTLAALQIFKQAKPDVILLEVGLGGRLDACNVVENDIGIITSIAYDHMQWLGNDLQSIAREKAGIARSNKPLIYGDPVLHESVKQHLQTLNAKLYAFNHDYYIEQGVNSWHWKCSSTSLRDLAYPKLLINNAAAGLMALEVLQTRLSVSEQAIRNGLASAHLSGRVEVVNHSPKIIYDVAHNPASVQNLADYIKTHFSDKYCHIVVGMLADKDIKNSLLQLKNIKGEWYAGELPTARSAKVDQLKDVLIEIGINKTNLCNTINQAFELAIERAQTNDIIIVFGSFFAVQSIKQFKESLSHAN